MSKMYRYLITTDDLATWKFDRPVIFLGEWCRNYSQEHIWKKMDAVVAPPYGLGKDKIDSDVLKANLIEKGLFPKLCSILNEYHKTEHSERFWRIIIGHWFHEYIRTILNRFCTLEACLSENDVSGITMSGSKHQMLTIERFEPNWYDALKNSQWNGLLYSRILEIAYPHIPVIERLVINQVQNSSAKQSKKNFSEQSKVKNFLYNLLKKLSVIMSKDSDAFIVSSYLPPLEALKLQISLFQFPSVWETPEINLKAKANHNSRRELTNKLVQNSDNELEKVVKTLLFEIFPIAYLEGLSEIQEITKNQKWPGKPKFIFTSNAFYSSDIYKYWIACKTENKTKYFVGQHGNSYFTDRYKRNSIEEVTADNFLTWGWSDGTEHKIPAFIFQYNSKKRIKRNSKGGLLLINASLADSRETFDVSYQALQYLKMNQTFLTNLAHNPKKNTTLRLSSSSSGHPFSEIERWQTFDTNLTLDEGYTPINKLLSENRLIVHSYDSTGILLTLSQNIPTLAYWLNGFQHLNDEVVQDYEILLKAGIIHLTPESAAEHVNRVWDSVDEWWSSDFVQEARLSFCERYARLSKNPSRDLKRILLRASKE